MQFSERQLSSGMLDIKEYLEENFATPAASTFASRSKAVGLARRIFVYVPPEGDEAVNRCRPDRAFKELKGIQKLHCVKTTPKQGRVFTRSCSWRKRELWTKPKAFYLKLQRKRLKL